MLIIPGTLGFAYGQFSYTKETHEAKIGPLELSMKDKETVNVPVSRKGRLFEDDWGVDHRRLVNHDHRRPSGFRSELHRHTREHADHDTGEKNDDDSRLASRSNPFGEFDSYCKWRHGVQTREPLASIEERQDRPPFALVAERKTPISQCLESAALKHPGILRSA